MDPEKNGKALAVSRGRGPNIEREAVLTRRPWDVIFGRIRKPRVRTLRAGGGELAGKAGTRPRRGRLRRPPTQGTQRRSRVRNSQVNPNVSRFSPHERATFDSYLGRSRICDRNCREQRKVGTGKYWPKSTAAAGLASGTCRLPKPNDRKCHLTALVAAWRQSWAAGSAGRPLVSRQSAFEERRRWCPLPRR